MMVMMLVVMMSLASLARSDLGWQHHNDLEVISCEAAQRKCAVRSGCGKALREYMIGCADIMYGKTTYCSDYCKKALIALTSTKEGQMLMKCQCSDEFCSQSKQRIEVCRPDVIRATHNDTIVSCSIAMWICAADPSCDTALNYYTRYCRHMFSGKRCSARCNNSISILERQEKAAKLKTCYCDGTDEYRWNCQSMKSNMDELCFKKNRKGGRKHHRPSDKDRTSTTTEMSNEILPLSGADRTRMWWFPVLLVWSFGFV